MAATWTPFTGLLRSRQSVQALTEAAPTLSSEGIDLAWVDSITVILHAPVGQTFTGAGVLNGYVFSNGLWVPDSGADVDLSYVAGKQDGKCGPGLPVTAPRGRFALIANGVALSGAGTTITIDLMCTMKTGLGAAA